MRTFLWLIVLVCVSALVLHWDQAKKPRLVLSTPDGYSKPLALNSDGWEQRIAQIEKVSQDPSVYSDPEPQPEVILKKAVKKKSHHAKKHRRRTHRRRI